MEYANNDCSWFSPVMTCTTSSVCCEKAESKKFFEVASGLRNYINDSQRYEHEQQCEAAAKALFASKDYETLNNLVEQYQEVQTALFNLSFWQSSKDLEAKRENITAQFKETAKRVAGTKFMVSRPYAYELYEIEMTVRRSIVAPRHLSWDEVKGKLHMIKDWEDKSFAQLVELIKNDQA